MVTSKILLFKNENGQHLPIIRVLSTGGGGGASPQKLFLKKIKSYFKSQEVLLYEEVGGLGPKICLWNSCWSPKFCLQKYKWQIPKFCPLNFRYDPKIGTFSQLLRLVVTELPKFSSYMVNLAGPCPKFASELNVRSKNPPPPPTSLFESTPLGFKCWSYLMTILKNQWSLLMRFQPILNTIFSKFSGAACPRIL